MSDWCHHSYSYFGGATAMGIASWVMGGPVPLPITIICVVAALGSLVVGVIELRK